MENDRIDDILNSPFSRRTFLEKVSVKERGRPTPDIKIVKSDRQVMRSFNVDWYARYWLAGSSSRLKYFCWPCVLFPANSNTDVWQKNGFDDMKNLKRSIDRHNASKDHIRAQINLKLLGKHRIDQAVNEGHRLQISQHNEEVKKNRDILKRFIDVTSLLSGQDIAFRGHDEGENSVNRGNYKELFDVFSRYDIILKPILDSKSFSGLSKTIQN